MVLADPMNDNEPPPVVLITGRVRTESADDPSLIQILLTAPDDDTAVRRALDALRRRGYVHAELDRIGEVEGEPEDEPQLSAYQGALEGEVSIIVLGPAR